jgi:hypothetical protein
MREEQAGYDLVATLNRRSEGTGATTSGTLNNGTLVPALFFVSSQKEKSYRQFCINTANGELIYGGLQKCHKRL